MKVPDTDGVPLIVIVLFAHKAVTPVGSPVGVPIPVFPEVVCVIAIKALLIHTVGVLEATLAVLFGVTVIVPVALTLPQPIVNGIV